MKYLETGSQGSFDIYGSGFRYRYSANDNALDITDTLGKRAFAHLKLDAPIQKDPLGYVRYLDRANQMKALIFSNDQTVRLAETVDEKMLASILQSASRLSYYAYSLTQKNFSLFSELFTYERGLKNVRVKTFQSKAHSTVFYAARIETMHNNAVCVRGCTLPGIMSALSEKTTHDLLTMEFGQQYSHSAQRLLRTSSQLSAISMKKRIKRNDITPHSAGKSTNFN
jgi:hypothetical protein